LAVLGVELSDLGVEEAAKSEEVNMAEAHAGTTKADSIISRDPKVHSGDLVFRGTRVPVDALVDYLTAGDSIEEFLKDFPTVERWQVEAYLQLSADALDHLREHGESPA
jgi:uncharacterized protein (DUF433 family)